MLLWGLLLSTTGALAGNQSAPAAVDRLQPAVSIIIDDLGNQQRSGLRAIDLPGAITYAILPHRPFTRLLARYAHRQNKEVMIHVPMEAESGAALGPGALVHDMAEKQFKTRVRDNFGPIRPSPLREGTR